MRVDFEALRADGWSPLDCAVVAESQGMSRLEIFKAIFTCWGTGPFAVDELVRYGSGYPSRAARAAATIGLAAVVLEYSNATSEEFAAFERVTGISRKVDGLARADRSTDALGFYDRLDPHSLSLTATSEAEARRVVLSMRAPGSPLSSIVVDSIDQYQWGWLFSPQLDHADRSPRPLQPGASVKPILFDRFSGAAIELDIDETLSAYVRRYEKTGWPFPS